MVGGLNPDTASQPLEPLPLGGNGKPETDEQGRHQERDNRTEREPDLMCVPPLSQNDYNYDPGTDSVVDATQSHILEKTNALGDLASRKAEFENFSGNESWHKKRNDHQESLDRIRNRHVWRHWPFLLGKRLPTLFREREQ
jgi:hypothetical protein